MRRNSEGVATGFVMRRTEDATLSGLRPFSKNHIREPRVAKAQPWARISERFQRYSGYPRLPKHNPGLKLANAFSVAPSYFCRPTTASRRLLVDPEFCC